MSYVPKADIQTGTMQINGKTIIAKDWIKTGLILSVIFMTGWISPKNPVDPWNLFSLKKIIFMIFALAFIQTLGLLMIQVLGSRLGAILTGFAGGLISSTATTASLARNSIQSLKSDVATENLTFLCATLAMLLEALAITVFGTEDVHSVLLVILLGPILATVIMIIFQSQISTNQSPPLENTRLDILPILKLSAFIIGILTFSKILQNIFGQSGLLALTFIMSLFEIHGSVIANVQLHDTGAITVQQLGGLLVISVAASYLSKLFLVFTLGSAVLKTTVAKSTAVLFFSLFSSWVIFRYLT